RLLCPFVLGGVDRVDACVAEHPRQLLRAGLAGGTQINIGIVRVNDFFSVADQNDGRDWPAKRCEVPEHNDRAKNRKQHREHNDSPQPGFWFRGFLGHLSINYSANSAKAWPHTISQKSRVRSRRVREAEPRAVASGSYERLANSLDPVATAPGTDTGPP